MIKYKRKYDTITGSIQDELVMMDIKKGKYFTLNPVATRIWVLLDKPLDIDEICNQLLIEYEVDTDQCRQEVEELLSEMVKLELILVVSIDL